MKVCLLGPSYPYRGGIAHYMTILAGELRQRGHEVIFLGFSRQYPQWIYPGRTDHDPSQVALEDDYIRVLDSLKPVTWLKTAQRVRDEHPRALLLSWWTSFWTPQFFTIAGLVRRSRATRIIFICHNVVEHETNRLKQRCTRAVLGLGDAFIVHSSQDRRQLVELLPGKRVVQVVHPSYQHLVTDRRDRREARRRLGVEGKVLLFFGFVRPYKGLEYAIRSLPLVLQRYDVTLVVAGEFWAGKRETLGLISQLGLDQRVRIVDRYIPNEEIGLYFGAADLLLLPYLSATQSGIVQIGYALGLPVVASRVGGFLDVVKPGKTGYLVEPRSPRAIAEAVMDFYDRSRGPRFKEEIRSMASSFTWDPLIRAIEDSI